MKKIACVFAVVFALTPAVWAAQFSLDLYAAKFDSIPLGVVEFKSTGAYALSRENSPSEIIAADLAFSPRFLVVRSVKADSALFVDRGIGIYLDGDYEISGTAVTVNCIVKDVATGQMVLGKKYQGELKDLRSLCHRYANELYKTITGDKGFFLSKILYVKGSEGVKNIALMDYDGADSRDISSTSTINIFPVFIDTTSILWVSYLRGKPDIYKGSLLDGRFSIFLYGRYVQTSPAVSPIDGAIVFSSSKEGNLNIYTCTPDKSETKRLTSEKCVNTSPCFSPTGAQIAFTSDRNGSPQIYTMDRDGTNVKRLTFDGTYCDSPAWSPKGDKIAFCSMSNGKFDIWTIGADGSNPTRVTTCSGSNEYPAWAPDGSHIVFSSTRGGKTDIFTVRINGTDIRQITRTGVARMPDWSSF